MAFVTGSTPFGAFDTDAQFQVDADKLVTWVTQKLGDPVLCVELSSSHIYACFEEAALEYSAIVNMYQARSVLGSLLGTSTGSLSGSEQRYPHRTMDFANRMAEASADDAGLNGSYPLYSASFTTVDGQQKYDLQALISGTTTDRIVPRQVFHFSPSSAYRFFGTTSAINYLHSQFGFESFTPETIFYLLPIWEDVLRGMQFETSSRVRRSNYSYELHNNVLTLYPVPTDAVRVHFTYTLRRKDPMAPGFTDPSVDGVANLANVPFGNITYSKLNSISKQWIRRMTFALAKETLGQIRGKISSIPVPNGEVTLNGAELVADGRALQQELREELKMMLEETTYDRIAEREAQMQDSVLRTLMNSPLKIYVG